MSGKISLARVSVVVALLLLFLIPGTVTGEDTVLLVTAEEAGMSTVRAAVKEVDEGPTIKINSPKNGSVLDGPFRLYIEIVKKADGAEVDMSSLKVNYLKVVTINITPRVKSYIEGTKLDVPKAEFPAGSHKTEIYIEDVEGNVSRKLFTVTVNELE